MSSTFVVRASSRYPLINRSKLAAVASERRLLIRATPFSTTTAPNLDLSRFRSKAKCCCCCCCCCSSFGSFFWAAFPLDPVFFPFPPNPPPPPPPNPPPPLPEDDFDANRAALSSCFHILRRFDSSSSTRKDCSGPDSISSSIREVGVDMVSTASSLVAVWQRLLVTPPVPVAAAGVDGDENADAAGTADNVLAVSAARKTTPSRERRLPLCSGRSFFVPGDACISVFSVAQMRSECV
mmetsp:Transcript_14329/g.32168  ORF Transcript_14329/g.32168 Transcript_14329/m.32168 type:complete len:238 (+) Transcript_14329:1309-2022(+)